jgi:hypothetical protein
MSILIEAGIRMVEALWKLAQRVRVCIAEAPWKLRASALKSHP